MIWGKNPTERKLRRFPVLRQGTYGGVKRNHRDINQAGEPSSSNSDLSVRYDRDCNSRLCWLLGKYGELGYNPGLGVGRRVVISGYFAGKGLSMHARSASEGRSFARYNLEGRYNSFEAVAAVNDSVRFVGSTIH